MSKLWKQLKLIFSRASDREISILDIQIDKEEKPDSVQRIYENTLSGISNMSERPDLLVSLDKIMLKSFPTLRDSDTLASAFSVFVLRDLEEAIVLADNGNFLGITMANAIYGKMPPAILDIPLKLRDRNNHEGAMSTSILETGRQQISDVLTLSKPNRLFQTVEPLSSLLSEINSLYNHYLMPRTIPIFDQEQTVQGIITYKEVLEYLKQDSFLSGLKVGDLCSGQCFREYVAILEPEDTLAIAEMMMEYTLTDYAVVFGDDGKIMGYLNKLWVSKLVHHSHFKLLNVSLRDLVQPLDINIKLVASTDSLLDVIQYLIDDNTKILVEPESINRNAQIRLITPLTIISLFLSSF
jgi:predicted transcriptional regulator